MATEGGIVAKVTWDERPVNSEREFKGWERVNNRVVRIADSWQRGPGLTAASGGRCVVRPALRLRPVPSLLPCSSLLLLANSLAPRHISQHLLPGVENMLPLVVGNFIQEQNSTAKPKINISILTIMCQINIFCNIM